MGKAMKKLRICLVVVNFMLSINICHANLFDDEFSRNQRVLPERQAEQERIEREMSRKHGIGCTCIGCWENDRAIMRQKELRWQHEEMRRREERHHQDEYRWRQEELRRQREEKLWRKEQHRQEKYLRQQDKMRRQPKKHNRRNGFGW